MPFCTAWTASFQPRPHPSSPIRARPREYDGRALSKRMRPYRPPPPQRSAKQQLRAHPDFGQDGKSAGTPARRRKARNGCKGRDAKRGYGANRRVRQKRPRNMGLPPCRAGNRHAGAPRTRPPPRYLPSKSHPACSSVTAPNRRRTDACPNIRRPCAAFPHSQPAIGSRSSKALWRISIWERRCLSMRPTRKKPGSWS